MTEVYGDTYLDTGLGLQVYGDVFQGEEVEPKTEFDDAEVWRGSWRANGWHCGPRANVWTGV